MCAKCKETKAIECSSNGSTIRQQVPSQSSHTLSSIYTQLRSQTQKWQGKVASTLKEGLEPPADIYFKPFLIH